MKQTGVRSVAEATAESADTAIAEPLHPQEPEPGSRPEWVIGIGSSAGGLEALSRLLASLPANLPASLVVVQHMSHTHRSLLVELLARETALSVSEIREGDIPIAGHVHVAPAKVHVELLEGRFHLIPAATPGVPVPSADRFLLSLADAWASRAVAVVLSGTGGDGAHGLRAVKLAGGATYAQSVESARYEGMPQAALNTGSVDVTLPPQGIGAALVKLLVNPGGATRVQEPVPTRARILTLARERTGVDLAQYKDNTIDRRLQRRVTALKLADEEHYLAYCESTPQELDRLLQESLISVTAFFRDGDPFEHLKRAVAKLVAERSGREEVRVWVPGCATGEEVYSLVILFMESVATLPDPPQLKVFATDIDGDAMHVARRGIYTSHALAAVSPERLARFFVPVRGGYEVKPELRAPVVFARHDLVRDPPFLRIDLLSCRNLLIYFKPSLQARVVPVMAYATAPQGYLFLGKSESVAQFRDLFDVVDKSARLFRSRGVRQEGLGFPVAREAPPPAVRPLRPNLRDKHEQALRHLFAPPSILVSRDGQILDVSGEAARYLAFPRDRLQFNLGAVFRGSEGVEAMSLLQRAARTRARVTGRTHTEQVQDAYRLVVDPLPGDENHFVVAFVPAPDPQAQADGGANADHETLRNELSVTREHLQTVIEELETSNEEMQALNEELQSANEELQSTNEELETSNEELQSTNEELTTVNDELARRAEQLAIISSELIAILRSLPFPVLLLDRELRVVRHNAAAEKLFGIAEDAASVPLARLQVPSALSNFAGEIAEVTSGGDMIERHVAIEGRDYLLLIARCEGPDVSGGVLVELVDVTRLTRAETAVRTAEAHAKSLMDLSPLLVATTDLHGAVGYVNPRLEAFLGTAVRPVMGRPVWDLFGRDGAETLQKRVGEVMTSGSVIECEHAFRVDTQSGQMFSLLYPLRDANGVASGYCLMAMDATELGAARDALERTDAINRAILDALASEIAVLDERGNILSVNDAWRRFAERNGGHDPGAWIGTSYLAACDVESGCPPAVPQGIRAVLDGRLSVFEHEYPCDSPEEQRWFRLLAARMDHSEARAVVMHIDITAAKVAQLAAEARFDQERALGASRERDLLQAIDEIEMFSYTVSHDLRAPLRAVLSFSDLLREELGATPSAPVADCLKRIGDAGRRMHLYIDEILKLSHLARGGLTTREVDMSAMAEEIVAEARAQRPERSIDCAVEPGLHARADPPLLRAVLENLIGNAFKYLDPQRRGEIVVGRLQVPDGHAFFVRDNGIGFDMSFRDKLFMPFQRLHHEAGIAGHGIGLAAVKRIIVRHGGRVWAEARPGFGATFFFTLP